MARRGSSLRCAAAVFALVAGCGPRDGSASPPAQRAADENRQGAFEFHRGDVRAAEQWFFSALERSRGIDDDFGQATALLNLSQADEARWLHERAQRRANQALAFAGENPELRGAALARLSAIGSRRGLHTAAIADARRARVLAESVHRRRRAKRRLRGDRATTLVSALVHAGGPHCAEAQVVLSAVPEIYGRAIKPSGQAAIAYLQGVLALGLANHERAESALLQALDIDRARGRPLDVATDLEALAATALAAKDNAAAIVWLTRALAVRESVDTPHQAIATAQQLTALGGGAPQLDGRIALLRSELGDAQALPPKPARPCD